MAVLWRPVDVVLLNRYTKRQPCTDRVSSSVRANTVYSEKEEKIDYLKA